MNAIVTHHAPDLDAITSVWMIKRFLPNWQDARIAFVPAGKTFKDEVVDSDSEVVHVDTGYGMFDHHQTDSDTCAAKLIYEYLKKHKAKTEWQDEALERLVEIVNFFDHFQEANLTDASADYHLLDAVNLIDGLKKLYLDDDHKIIEIGFIMMDAYYRIIQEQIWAEELFTQGIEFTTPWGKGIAFETLNDTVLKLAAKLGYLVAVRKDPKKGYVRIKGLPNTTVDFTQIYQQLKLLDPEATWFLHSSKKILLNGTTKNPDMKPTKLTLNEIIEVLRKE